MLWGVTIFLLLAFCAALCCWMSSERTVENLNGRLAAIEAERLDALEEIDSLKNDIGNKYSELSNMRESYTSACSALSDQNAFVRSLSFVGRSGDGDDAVSVLVQRVTDDISAGCRVQLPDSRDRGTVANVDSLGWATVRRDDGGEDTFFVNRLIRVEELAGTPEDS